SAHLVPTARATTSLSPSSPTSFLFAITGPPPEYDFLLPTDVVIDASGNTYLSEPGNNVIKKFDPSGSLLMTIGQPQGSFYPPEYLGLAMDYSGALYATDLANGHVYKFDSSGQTMLVVGSSGDGAGQFRWPNDVAVDGFGNIWVNDLLSDKLQEFDASGN